MADEPEKGPPQPQPPRDWTGIDAKLAQLGKPPPVKSTRPGWLASAVTMPQTGSPADAARRATEGFQAAARANPPPQPLAPRQGLGSVHGTLRQQPSDMSRLEGTLGGSPPPQGRQSPVQFIPTPPRGSAPYLRLPKGAGSVPLPGAGNATLFLFVSLALVATWREDGQPAWDAIFHNKPMDLKIPNTSILSLLIFGLILVFASSLSPDIAEITVLFMLALWAVFLVMNPSFVQTIAGWASQGNQTAGTQQASQASSSK